MQNIFCRKSRSAHYTRGRMLKFKIIIHGWSGCYMTLCRVTLLFIPERVGRISSNRRHPEEGISVQLIFNFVERRYRSTSRCFTLNVPFVVYNPTRFPRPQNRVPDDFEIHQMRNFVIQSYELILQMVSNDRSQYRAHCTYSSSAHHSQTLTFFSEGRHSAVMSSNFCPLFQSARIRLSAECI